MVVRESNGKFLTQRQKSDLALVETCLPDSMLRNNQADSEEAPFLKLTAPGMSPLMVPLASRAKAVTRNVTVWEWTGPALDEGDEAAQWFSQYLGLPTRLVRHLGAEEEAQGLGLGEAAVRLTDPAFAEGYETRFTDGFPSLLATEASLADLNSRMAVPLPMCRFRPNIILSGTSPWEEDQWSSVVVQGQDSALDLDLVKPCSRCKVPTINQDTGEEGDEPLATLGTFRSGELLGWNKQNKSWTHDVFFGWNVVNRQAGRIRVGDKVELRPRVSPAS